MRHLKQTIEWLLYTFIFLLPLQTRWIYQQGFLNGEKWEYGTFSLYATELLFGLILILSIVYAIARLVKNQEIKKTKKQLRRVFLLVLILLLVSLSCFLALNPQLAFYKFSHLIMAAALFAIIAAMKLDWQKFSWAIILGGLLQSILAIQQFMTQEIFANKWLGMAGQNPETLGVPVVQLENLRWLRSFGSLPHPNILAGFLVIGLILIIGLYSIIKTKKPQNLLRLVFVVNFLGLMTTLSRAAILSFVVGIIILTFLSRKNIVLNKASAKFALIALFIFVVFTVSFPELILTRTLSSNRVENISNVTRVEQYGEAGQILTSTWLTGTGPGNYVVRLYSQDSTKSAWDYQPIHNTYLLIFAELGILGLASILLFVFYVLFNLFKCVSWSAERLTGLTCLAALAGLALFDHYLWSFYFGIMLVAIVLSLVKNNNFKTL